MKYKVPMRRTMITLIDVEIDADSPAEALRHARSQRPGYEADEVLEPTADPDEPKVHELAATCEGCDKMIFAETEDAKHYIETDDGAFCRECVEKAAEAATPPASSTKTGEPDQSAPAP